MNNFSIVPEIINSRQIRFIDERGFEIKICEDSDLNYIPPFEIPFLKIDRFKKKTLKPADIVKIDINDLSRLGVVIASRKTSHGWLKGQKVIYLLEKRTNRSANTRPLKTIPSLHIIQKDIANKKVRLRGPNAGPNKFGDWVEYE